MNVLFGLITLLVVVSFPFSVRQAYIPGREYAVAVPFALLTLPLWIHVYLKTGKVSMWDALALTLLVGALASAIIAAIRQLNAFIVESNRYSASATRITHEKYSNGAGI